MRSDTPLKDLQKSIIYARTEHTIQSVQVGLLYVVLRTILSCTLGRLALLAGLGYTGWKIGFLFTAARFDQHMVPVYLLSTAAVLYTVRMLVQGLVNPGPEARHRTLTRPLWSVVHFQRLMALSLLLPAILPLAARGHLPRPGRYDDVSATLVQRQEIIDHWKAELLIAKETKRVNGIIDRETAKIKREQYAKTMAEVEATPDRWKQERLIEYAKTNYDGNAHEEYGEKRDADVVQTLERKIAKYEAANSILRRRGYLTELDRWGNEDLLMGKP